MNPHSLVYALAAILLGVVGIVFHDFAMQWQPVPAGIAMRTQLAYVAGAVLVAGGALLLVRKFERAGAWLLAVFVGLWMLVLNLPVAVASASHIGAWNSPAEIGFLTSGALALAASSITSAAMAADFRADSMPPRWSRWAGCWRWPIITIRWCTA